MGKAKFVPVENQSFLTKVGADLVHPLIFGQALPAPTVYNVGADEIRPLIFRKVSLTPINFRG